MFLPCAVLLFACPLLLAASHPNMYKRCNEYKPEEYEYKRGLKTVIVVCPAFAYHSHCLTPKRTRIPVGDTIAENGTEYSCVSDDGILARLVEKEIKTGPLRAKRDSAPQDLLCKGQYKNGERFTFGNYIKECKSTPNSWDIAVVACLTPQKREIAVGDNAFEEGFEYSCLKTGNFASIHALKIRYEFPDNDS